VPPSTADNLLRPLLGDPSERFRIRELGRLTDKAV